MFFNPALFHGAGTNRTSDVRRMANLLQISSALAGVSTYSRSQESGTRIGQCPAGNWVPKRRSALKRSRMSPMPWRSIAMRSGPMPKA